jgi:hypothetical protein
MGSEVGGLGLIPPGNEHSVRLVHRAESVQTGSNVSPQNESNRASPSRPRGRTWRAQPMPTIPPLLLGPDTWAGDSGPRSRRCVNQYRLLFLTSKLDGHKARPPTV